MVMFADFEYFMQKISLGYSVLRYRDCGILEWNPVPFLIPSRTRIPSRYRFLRDTGWGLVSNRKQMTKDDQRLLNNSFECSTKSTLRVISAILGNRYIFYKQIVTTRDHHKPYIPNFCYIGQTFLDVFSGQRPFSGFFCAQSIQVLEKKMRDKAVLAFSKGHKKGHPI